MQPAINPCPCPSWWTPSAMEPRLSAAFPACSRVMKRTKKASSAAGLLVLVAVAKGDTTGDADYLVEKVLGLRIFPDQDGKMNHSVVEVGGSLLVVSNFTLYGDCGKGRRPSFDLAAGPEQARSL